MLFSRVGTIFFPRIFFFFYTFTFNYAIKITSPKGLFIALTIVFHFLNVIQSVRVCVGVGDHRVQQVGHQGTVANLAFVQLNRAFRSRLRIWPRKIDSAVPSGFNSPIPRTRGESNAYSWAHVLSSVFRDDGVHLNRQRSPEQSPPVEVAHLRTYPFRSPPRVHLHSVISSSLGSSSYGCSLFR